MSGGPVAFLLGGGVLGAVEVGPGGVLAALDAAPGTDVIVVAHTGWTTCSPSPTCGGNRPGTR